MELQWIGLAFVAGLAARALRQPALLGFLAAGFVLELVGLRVDDALRELADLGILLLLFTIGLKLDLRSLVRAHVLVPSLAHMALGTAALTLLLAAGAWLALGPLSALDLEAAAILGFALSFSSTVLAVKILEERDDMGAVYGRTAIGVLIVQDVAAVAFLAVSKGEVPSPWALALLGLVPLRPWLRRVLDASGHGELLVLAGLSAALGGAELFELVGLKADLGALVAGVLLAGTDKAKELAHALLGLKEVFLVGFFLSIGLTGLPTFEMLLVALGLALALPLKGFLFLLLFGRLRLRMRTAWLASASLASYSEFGLIVGAVAVSAGWLPAPWLVTLALALGLSFVFASILNGRALELHRRLRARLAPFESAERIDEERSVDVGDADALVFGMGRIGSAAFDVLRETVGSVVGFDLDDDVVSRHRGEGRVVFAASATDAELWERLHIDRERVRLVLLAMTSHHENRAAIRQLRAEGYEGAVAVAARFDDEVEGLRAEGADVVFVVHSGAGAAFASMALEAIASPTAAQ